jgi:hypothetical protein
MVKEEEVGACQASQKVPAPRSRVKKDVKEEVGACAGPASKKAPASRLMVKKDVKEEVAACASLASQKAPASRLTVKPDIEEVDVGGFSGTSVKQEVGQDEDPGEEPVKRRRTKKDRAQNLPSEVLDREADTAQRPKYPRSRAKEVKKQDELAAAHTEHGLPSLAGLLPSSGNSHDGDLPLEIPQDFYGGGLHLPNSVVEVKSEKPGEDTFIVDMAPIPWSDSGAVCRQVLDALIKEPSSDLHSMSPVMKSFLIHVLESMEPKAPAKKGQKKKAGKNDDMIASLMGLDHDAAALQRMQQGWSYPWGPGRHHDAVNMMGQVLEMQEKKRPQGS